MESPPDRRRLRWQTSSCSGGLREKLSAVGLEVIFHSSDWSQARRTGWENQQAKMVHWLQPLPKSIGVLACNDFRGQHVLEACRVAQTSVPDQVAVIGVDNDQVICDFCQPSPSSVIPAAELIGFRLPRLHFGGPFMTNRKPTQPTSTG